MFSFCCCHQNEIKKEANTGAKVATKDSVSDSDKYKNSRELVAREDIAYKALYALSTQDINTLSDYISADSGLIISSFSGGKYKFKKEVIKAFSKSDKTKYLWGAADGSGEDINLSIADYIKENVYTEDYLNVKPIDVIKALQSGKSFSSNNFDEIMVEHPNCYVKSFHCPSDHWNIIDIVETCKDGKWYIVEIRHRCWTI